MCSTSYEIAYCRSARIAGRPVYTAIKLLPGLLEISIFVQQPPASWAQALATGKLTYGLVEPLPGFPLLLLLPGNCGLVVEAGIKLLRLPPAQAQAWLSEAPITLHLALLDATTNVVVAARQVPTVPEFGHQLRQSLAQQQSQARTPEVANDVYQLLEQAYEPRELLNQATLFQEHSS